MKQRKVSLTKTKWLAALLLVAVFSAGIATGMVFSTLTRAKRQRDFRPPPDHLPHRGLNLTADQEKKAREIGERYRGKLDAIRERIRPEVDAIHTKMSRELYKILTPEQRKLHDSHGGLRGNHQGPPRHGEHHPGGGPGMGPGGPRMNPPQAALAACENKKHGAPCSFASPRGNSVAGQCRKHPHSPSLACVPRDHIPPAPGSGPLSVD